STLIIGLDVKEVTWSFYKYGIYKLL
ncbi:MAG: hypothetical protein JWQ28_1548, partial [Pedobacter sp.]|nr:hypothetical protein [Pedobacter sp.]